jgi:arylsulfatase
MMGGEQKMNRRLFLQTMAGAAAGASLPGAAPPRRPNILVILNDDMGFSDLGCYGGEIRTPNLDRLARGGVRFTQFYNTARCCPTRASLLTGLYPHQAGVGHMMDDRGVPGYRGDLNRQCVTIAEALRPAGYRTYMSGKWHVTRDLKNKHNWPLERGFERYYGIITGGSNYFNPSTLVRDNTPIEPEGERYHLTDALSDQAARYIGEHGAGPQPFFLYLAYTSPHWPLHAWEEDIARYKGRYKEGWDALRRERHRRMIEMGIVERRWPLTARDPAVPAWSEAPNREWHERRMEVYAAQIEAMDRGIGRVLQKLEETGQMENTLLLFLADNGGCAEELRSTLRGAHFRPSTRDGRPVRPGNDPAIMPGAEDTYASYGIGWANASNTPFRLYKHWVHEGGISTPLIAHWPAAVRNAGTLSRQPGHVIDIMATALDVAGAKYPESHQGNRVTPLEGLSLRPVLENGRRRGHPEIYWEHEGNRAVRQGRWKLVSRHPNRWELYDVEADRTEMNDLSPRQSGRAAELAAKYEAWAKARNVLPWGELPKPRA